MSAWGALFRIWAVAGRRSTKKKSIRTARSDPLALGDSPQRRATESWCLPLRAWIALSIMPLALKWLGFVRVYRWILARDVAELKCLEVKRLARRVLEGTNSASGFVYRRRQDCLPRALTVLLLLKGVGLRGSLCIGVKRLPFESHAWVECGDLILDERPSRIRAFTVLHRTPLDGDG